jgi:predicted metal-dependent HD superfamily phosphohydrolase
MDSTTRQRLHAHWHRLLGTNANPPRADIVFEDLVARYVSPERHYHNLDHIHHVLTWLSEQLPPSENDVPLGLAVWFHDAVYDPRATDNEEQSAQLARTALTSLGVPEDLIAEVARLIPLTRTHVTSPDDRAGLLLLDADLAILGADPAIYEGYARAIRQEYAWVPEEAYRLGRLGILTGFLRRSRIYHTPLAYDTCEMRARHNLRHECDTLTGLEEKK